LGIRRVRYQRDAKFGDVVEQAGAFAYDAHRALKDGLKRPRSSDIDQARFIAPASRLTRRQVAARYIRSKIVKI
jgi:hypothetical protein